MAENISPEERLFKVIQDEKKTSTGGGGFKKKLSGGLRGCKQFFANLELRPKSKARRPASSASIARPIKLQDIDPRLINKGLMVILAGLTPLAVYYMLNNKPSMSRITNAIARIQVRPIRKGTIETFKPAAFYLEEVRKRNIFEPVSAPSAKEVAPKTEPALEKLGEMAKNFKLEGISWGVFPKAMIRNVKEDRIYFLKKGQTIGATGIAVKSIDKNKVVISYEGAEIELL